MNDSNPPLPQPAGATCSNCGAAQSASAPFCTACGAALRVGAPSPMSQTGKVIASLALGCGALIFGGFGGCLVFLGNIGDGSPGPTFYVLVGVAALLTLACIWGIFRIQRK